MVYSRCDGKRTVYEFQKCFETVEDPRVSSDAEGDITDGFWFYEGQTSGQVLTVWNLP
jgi:hypothetical protein